MTRTAKLLKTGLILSLVISLSACSGIGNVFDPNNKASEVPDGFEDESRTSTIWDLFNNSDDPNTTLKVNKYLWNASLDVLNFLPVQAADPFSGVIVMGYGTPPGGGRAYRATVYIRDPALDARSIEISLQTRSGAADIDTVRAIEDAIMTRARQLRIRDGNL